MSDSSETFKVDFSPDMTMSYLDRHGLLKFVFEVASERRPKTVFLYSGAVDASLKDIPKSPANRPRIDEAFNRVVKYLQSLGYEVDVID